jgi:transcription initiation factor TFIIIB Brf1 subunit/transcription initiation factor TFIIB
MERAGLVWRRTDSADQRLTRVGLTDEGRHLQQQLETVIDEYMNATLARLPDNDRRQLARLLRTWRALADQALARGAGADGSPGLTDDAAQRSSRGTTA